jgi:allantoate deiminase
LKPLPPQTLAQAHLPDAANLAKKVVARCRELAAFSEDSGSLRRTFLSPPMRDVHQAMASWVKPLGAAVKIDAAGNFRALYPHDGRATPRLLIGSHLDTVPNAGVFDGILGVVIAVALLEGSQGKDLPFAIEIIGFSEEEGVRFGTPFIGSRALVGRVEDKLLDVKDCTGASVREAIKTFDLNPAEMHDAIVPDNTCAYLEFHIEQGPVLEKLGRPLAAVEAIAGQTRQEFTFVGRTNHAGTTPMNQRFDAVAGAAEWITTVERLANSVIGLVATVGLIQSQPGAVNVIAGEARASLDVRHRDDGVRASTVQNLVAQAVQIAKRRSLVVRYTTNLDQPAVAMDSYLVAEIERSIREIGCDPHRMVSGAGHDAMILAERVPSAMVFLRTPGGISHDPAESVLIEDVAKALECGLQLLQQLASSSKFLSRASRE